MNILWLSPDSFNAFEMRPLISRQGYGLVHVPDLDSAVEAIVQQRFALGIIELGALGENEGLKVCRQFVEVSPFPVIVSSCQRSMRFKRAVFEAGAIDHVTQPYDRETFQAQIASILRLDWPARNNQFERGEIQRIEVGAGVALDATQRKLIVRGAEEDLTPTEFRLLAYLVDNAGRVLDREELLNAVWGYDHTTNLREVDVYIRYLRVKIEPEPIDPQYIVTHWGVGYEFVPDPSGPAVQNG